LPVNSATLPDEALGGLFMPPISYDNGSSAGAGNALGFGTISGHSVLVCAQSGRYLSSTKVETLIPYASDAGITFWGLDGRSSIAIAWEKPNTSMLEYNQFLSPAHSSGVGVVTYVGFKCSPPRL
jgi:hypothetical protein